MSKVLGLDLGSGMSCVAVVENETPTVVANKEGNRTTPSVVQIVGDDVKIGDAAKRSMITKPKNTIFLIKRLMGADWNDSGVQEMLKRAPYDIVNKNGKPYVKIDGKEYSPEQISSMIVGEMKKTAEAYTGSEIKEGVITVPAWFGDAARSATKTAGELAGLKVLRVIAEPTAAILNSPLAKEKKDQTIAVFDFGAGTLDVSVCELSDGMVEVLASDGDVWLGGSDIDNAIVKYVADEFEKENGVDIRKDSMALARLVEAAEKAKIELSSLTQTDINLPYIAIKDNTPLNLTMTISRAKFDNLIKDLVKRCIDKTREAIKKAKKEVSDIDAILLVGGSTRIPAVQDALKKEFGRPLSQTVNPDEAVALGACKQAAILSGEDTSSDLLLLDVTPLSLGIETKGDVFCTIIPANTTIPTTKSQVFSTAVNNQPEVEINVLQGERSVASGNKSIGRFKLDGIMPAPAGVPQIEVKFDIDANGIVSVSAKDLGTNKEQHITIQNNKLSDDEIKSIKEDAEKFKEADEKKKKLADTVNGAEQYVYSINNVLNDKNTTISDDDKKKVTDALDKLNEAIKSNDEAKITEAQKNVETVWNPIVQEIYKKTAEAKNAAANNDTK